MSTEARRVGAADASRHDARPAWRSVARAAGAVASGVLLALTGVGWWGMDQVIGGITVSQALGVNAPRSEPGAMNILLMGLDSRKDQNGNDLSADVLDKLHAGDSDDGGYNTNTLILVHVGSDDRVSAFSIPRDDYVDVEGIVPGYDHIKIKEAYGLTKANAEQALVDAGEGDQQILETKGREAGRAATVKVVHELTGVPIDYFAEISLAGFYDLAKSLDGVQVCLNSAVYDEYSGADFPAGRQTLNAEQALAFVRQRHGLDNGDLDRTHRQQAFLLGVMQQLSDAGSLTDLTKLNGLLDVVHRDVVVSAGWGSEQFRRIAALAGGHVEFQTLPVLGYDNVDGQDVNVIDANAIRAQVTATFEGDLPDIAATASPKSTVDVINAGSTPGLASTVSDALRARGFSAGEVRNAAVADPVATGIDAGPGTADDARTVMTVLGLTDEPRTDESVATGHIRVVLGEGYVPPASLAETNPTADPAADTETASNATPDQGKPIYSGQIPCVD